MSIHWNPEKKVFSLHTKRTTYQMKISEYGHLLHTYYGKRITDEDASYAVPRRSRSFSNFPHEATKVYSLGDLPQEFSSADVGDYRPASIGLVNADGSFAFEGKYYCHFLQNGTTEFKGLPELRAIDGETTETLTVVLKDAASNVSVGLYYTVFEEKDIITRAVRVVNEGVKPIHLTRIMSATLDLLPGQRDVIHFWGHHNIECNFERTPLGHGTLSLGSTRGETSQYENNSVILCSRDTTEDHGDCYGFSFMYSGNFLLEAHRNNIDHCRVVMGIHPDRFDWILDKGESFTAPQVVMCYSADGLTALSHRYHDAYRENLCQCRYMHEPRPVLINSWEAVHFTFDLKKLVSIAEESLKMGVDLFVLDDGWFGKREDDTSGLGDWYTNEKKLGGTLAALSDRIHALGMKFGLWFEPEMISEDSDLYRAHPDWAIAVPGRAPAKGRNQLVLDFSREDVQDYIIRTVGDVLDSAKIEYVKWDFNRVLCDIYSCVLPPERQGEVLHRFVLGLYRVMDALMTPRPDVLFEGCSGGGGRFDAAMLYYQPQIWASDNTDAFDRLFIQYGTSFFYPVSSMGAHVSVSPNIRTGRQTTFETRSIVAMSGTYGYELDTTKMTEEEKAYCKERSDLYRKYQPLIFFGDYYRVSGPYDSARGLTAWNFVSKDKTEALANAVLTDPAMHDIQLYVKVKGLDPDALYAVSGSAELETPLSGRILAEYGIPVANSRTPEYTGYQFYLKKI